MDTFIGHSTQNVNGNGLKPYANGNGNGGSKPYINGNGESKLPIVRRQYRSSRRHFRDGQRAAALRAFTAGQHYLVEPKTTLAGAATACGSNVPYVQAAVVLLKHGDDLLIGAVLNGSAPVLEAARRVRRVAELTSGYRKAGTAGRIRWPQCEGVEKFFNDALAPAIA